MKKRGSRNGGHRRLRRSAACMLAVLGMGLSAGTAGLLPGAGTAVPTFAAGGKPEPEARLTLWQRLLLTESAVLSQWADEPGPAEPDRVCPEGTTPEEAQEEREMTAQPPAPAAPPVQGGVGAGYQKAGDIALFNRTSKIVDAAGAEQAGSSLSFAPASEGPQILIMHTHGTEAFAQNASDPYPETGTARTTDRDHNIMRVGDEIARIWTELGLNVCHDTEFYDYPAYNGCYERSKAGTEALLAKYPTIRMVVDIHRDALLGKDGKPYRPAITLDGTVSAPVMLLVGTDDAGAYFPDWPEHLALAIELQRRMNDSWPGLARPIVLRTARFNQQLTKGSLLLEVGSHGNSLDEALVGARLFARASGPALRARVADP